MLPNIKTHFPEWYQDVIYKAELVDQSPVRGMMVIRPYGYAIWEEIKGYLDQRIKETGHQNISLPLFIPQSFLSKEADHVKGFAPELAIVTHAGGKKLQEPLVVRPTSETLVHHMFARWLNSWRDLPLKINQWANVVRWELRPRPFLRTTEFFWQEGHTAHATHQEAQEEMEQMAGEYATFIENYLAIPVIMGEKSEFEKFPGALKTVTLEAIMPDGKALQMGTSHLLSQDFAKAFDMSFQDKNGQITYPHLTSWAVTTRLIGALVMVHGDEKGLVIPPKIAPIQVVIIPILKTGSDNQELLAEATHIKRILEGEKIRVYLDDDETKTPGSKFYQWELKGVPLRIELGPRDIKSGNVVIVSRISDKKEDISMSLLPEYVPQKLHEIQVSLLSRARQRCKDLWHVGEKLSSFGTKLEKGEGLYETGWCFDKTCEQALKPFKATIRCLLDSHKQKQCFNCDNSSKTDILIGKAY
jgi:prolyl-tRNA synthetase